LKRLIGDRAGIARRLGVLFKIALIENESEKAEAYLKEARSIIESLDAPIRKLEMYQILKHHFEVQADWPRAIQEMKEGLQLAVQLDHKRYILFLNLALARYYTYAKLPNPAKIYLVRGARIFFATDLPDYHSDCLLTFGFYWLAVNNPSHSAECFVYFLRLNGDNPMYKPEADRLSLALETHFSTVELDNLQTDLPVREAKELIRQYLDKLVS